MDRKFLRKTHFQGLRRVGVGGRHAQDSWYQIDAHLREALTAEHAAVFSEPVVAADGTMDWYGSGDGELRFIEELSDDERVELSARFRKLHTEVQAHAETLLESKTSSNQRIGAIIQAALSFGQQPGQPLPVVAMGKQPVLVNWGTKLDSAAPTADPLEDFVTAVDAKLPRKPAPAIPAAPVAVQAVTPVFWPAWLAWALFAALLALLFALLLAPCGVSGLTGMRLCPSVDVTRASIAPRTDQLLAEVAGLEDALRRAPLCPVIEEPPAPPPPEPEPEPEPDPRSEADRRREEAGGQMGELTITLTWDNYTDLDLHLYCQGGHIYFGNSSDCGGQLDVDANVSASTLRPVENIYFSQLPSGRQFTVRVHNFRERTGGTPYRLEVTMNGERDVYTGRLNQRHREESITVRVP